MQWYDSLLVFSYLFRIAYVRGGVCYDRSVAWFCEMETLPVLSWPVLAWPDMA